MELEAEGIIFLSVAWSSVIGLLVYCYLKVLKNSNRNT